MEKGRIKLPKIPYSKRKDGRYYKQIIIGVDVNGKRKVKTLYDRDWHALDRKVREFTIGLEQGKYVDKQITLGECIDMWIQGKHDVSTGTRRNYRVMQKMLQPLAQMKIDKIKPIQIEYLYADLYERGVVASIRNLSVFLKRIYRFAINNRFANINIAEQATVPKINIGRRRGLTDTERSALLQAFEIFNNFEKAFVGIAYYAGLRRNEILALTVDDVDLDNRTISVNKTLVADIRGHAIVQNHPKTKAGVRTVVICERLSDILTEYLSTIKDSDNRMFVTSQGNNVSTTTFYYRWKATLKKINKYMPDNQSTAITPHYLRHNCATDLIYAGVPIKSVQYMMGHENIDMTLSIYTDIRMDNESVIQTMNSFWK